MSVKCILYIQLMVAGALLINCVSIEEWLAATTFLKERNSVTYKEKYSFRNK